MIEVGREGDVRKLLKPFALGEPLGRRALGVSLFARGHRHPAVQARVKQRRRVLVLYVETSQRVGHGHNL